MTSARPALLHEFFELVAARTPDGIAVDVPPGAGRAERVRITYGELRRLALGIAARIRPTARPDDVVGILLPRDSHLLYAAQLGVLYAGGAFTCPDLSFPDEHLRAVLEDACARVILTDASGAARLARIGIDPALCVDVRSVRGCDDRSRSDADERSLAYVIYTSGTTGTPKGVMIEHRSIAHLVASDLDEFSLGPGDRVAQGSSAAYDSSIEETWLALGAGATLVLMDDDASRLGPDLVPWLRDERITVFCPPPTLLRTTGCEDPHNALPSLRLLYVGGEALPEDLASRWSRGRRLVNGYGPTECTVTVVRGDVIAGAPVTIGRPVRGHTALALDENLSPVADGAEGELCIAGPGLARGYRNRAELTTTKFPTHPALGRIYRTGDLIKRNAAGDLEYLGRIDAQVKLRGYRIELEAIESRIAACPSVREAACRVQETERGPLLAAHIVPMDGAAPPELSEILASLRASLPRYMVPSRVSLADTLPRSVGGKLDRRALPDLPDAGAEPAREIMPARDELEALVIRAFGAALKTSSPIGAHDDFFAELGGDSLSAVGVVCELRTHALGASVTTRDLFRFRNAEGIAGAIRTRAAPPAPVRRRARPSESERASPLTVTVLQCLWLLLATIGAGTAGYIFCFDLVPFVLDRLGLAAALATIPVAIVAGGAAYLLVTVALTAAVKWTFIGRYTPTVARAWGEFYFRHWCVEQTARLIPWGWLAGTEAYGLVLRLLGAKVGRGVHIHHGVDLHRGGWDLLTLGDDVSLNCDCWLGLVELDDGCLHISPVTIGPRATLEVRAGVSGGATVEEDGLLTALSWLPSACILPRGERWDGVPAEPAGVATPPPQITDDLSPLSHTALMLGTLALRSAIGSLPFLAVVCAAMWAGGLSAGDALGWLSDPRWSNGLLQLLTIVPPLWLPCSLVLQALALRAIGRVGAGAIGRRSLAYVRVWHKSAAVEAAGRWLSGTLFWPVWLRLAGMRVGRNCEISTIIDVVPESIAIGDECFFADGIYLGGPRVHRGTVKVGETSLSRGTFLGNHAVVPAGVQLPAEYFAGVCTVTSQEGPHAGASWFGHPAMQLPRREVIGASRSVTHEPGPVRFATRAFWESLRFALPVLPLLLLSVWLGAVSVFGEGRSWAFGAFVGAPSLLLASLVGACAFVLALKWLLLGRSSPGQHPLWSCWCSRWDFLYVAWQFYALAPLSALQGTLVLNAYLRLTGARIGRRALLGPGFAQLVDPDMLHVEEGATLNANLQAHSFEDRVLKLAHVHIRRGATVGENTVVFYGADIGPDVWVAPNSVVMKNEYLGAETDFAGCPVRPAAPAPTVLAASHAARVSSRIAALDVARGLAVVGMVFLHFVPGAESLGALDGFLPSVAAFLEGKPAALFCVLAGFAWQFQLGRAARPRWYFARRAGALLIAGLALHALAWPTEVLVPLSVMMLCCIGARRAGRAGPLVGAIIVLALTPLAHRLYAPFITSDWMEDGSHLSDHQLGLSWARALLFDGNYPLLPWLAFPLIGMIMGRAAQTDARAAARWLVPSVIVAVIAQLYALWSASNAAALGGLEWCLACEWVPTTLPFFTLGAASALAIIALLLRVQLTRGLSWALHPLSLIGRSSLTHYLAHICLLYTPLRLCLGDEEWSVATGFGAFVLYFLVAAPATALWFRSFTRGPAEMLWALASGVGHAHLSNDSSNRS